MNDLSIQKIQIAVFSTVGEPFDAVIDTLLDGELSRSLEFSQSAKNKMGAESKIKSMILKLLL